MSKKPLLTVEAALAAIQDTIQEDLRRMNSTDDGVIRRAANRPVQSVPVDKRAKKAERKARLDALRNSQFTRKRK